MNFAESTCHRQKKKNKIKTIKIHHKTKGNKRTVEISVTV